MLLVEAIMRPTPSTTIGAPTSSGSPSLEHLHLYDNNNANDGSSDPIDESKGNNNIPPLAALPDIPPKIDSAELKEVIRQDFKPLHFVFAYGSLICKKSRAITAPTLAGKDAIPVQIQDVERIWAKRTQRGMTAMGVRFRKGAKCTGVLLHVNDAELVRFDKREVGYDRFQIPLDDVEEIPFLTRKDHYEKMDYEHADVVFGEDETAATAADDDKKGSIDKPRNSTVMEATGTDESSDTNRRKVYVWMYVQRYDSPANEDFPIAQSYVDIIMRGCMGIDKEFAKSFIETTKGWAPEEVYGDGADDDEIHDSDDEDEEETPNNGNSIESQAGTQDDDEEEGKSGTEEDGAVWVDDREDPIYMRADPAYSEKKADVIDQLLEDHIPEHLDNREPVAEEEEKKE